MIRRAALLAVCCFTAHLSAQEPAVSFGDAAGQPGEVVSVPVYTSQALPLLDAWIAFEFDAERLEPLAFTTEGSQATGADPFAAFLDLEGATGLTGFGSRRRGPDYTVMAPAGEDVHIGSILVRIRADAAAGDAVIAPTSRFRNGGTQLGIGTGEGVTSRTGVTPRLDSGGPIRISAPDGPRPVGDLVCAQFLDRIQLSFALTDDYDSIIVSRNGEVIANVDGLTTSLEDPLAGMGQIVYSVVAEKDGERSITIECRVVATAPAAPSVTGIECTANGVRWENPVAFDRIVVFRDGVEVAELAGTVESYVDPERPSEITVYTVISELEGFRSPEANCVANGIWAVEVEDVQVPVDADEVTIPLLVTTALRVRGFSLSFDIDLSHFDLVGTPDETIQGTPLFQQPDFLVVNVNPRTGYPSLACVIDMTPPYDTSTDLLPGLRYPLAFFRFATVGEFAEGDSFPVTWVEAETAFSAKPGPTPAVVSAAPSVVIGGEVRFGAVVPPVEGLGGEVSGGGGTEGGGGGVQESSVRLTWRNAGPYDGLEVERNGEVIAELRGGETEYVDEGVPSGVFTYKVRAVEGERSSFPASTFLSTISPLGTFLRGDTNRDGRINLSDPVATVTKLFRGGGAFPCEDAADANDDGVINLSDAVLVLNYLFRGSVIIRSPGTRYPWYDPTEDGLSCRN